MVISSEALQTADAAPDTLHNKLYKLRAIEILAQLPTMSARTSKRPVLTEGAARWRQLLLMILMIHLN